MYFNQIMVGHFNEIMVGRYEERPDATSFPNDTEDPYDGMLVVRSEIRSVCSHHHQPVSGVAYIGLLAAQKLIGSASTPASPSGAHVGAPSRSNSPTIS